MRRLRWLLLLAPATLLLAVGSSAQAAPLNGQLAYLAGHDYVNSRPMDVWLTDAGFARAPYRIARTGVYAYDPAFSPDGRWIAYVARFESVFGEADELFVMSAAGGPPRQLTRSAEQRLEDDRDPSFAPDGQSLVFVRGGAVHTLDARGGTPRALTPPERARFPVYSPDGGRIAYVRGQPPQSELVVMNADGTGGYALDAARGADSVDWSRAGDALVFGRRESFERGDPSVPFGTWTETRYRTYLTDPAGTTARPGPDGIEPRFSPDGTQLVYRSFDSGSLATWDIASGAERSLSLQTSSRPAWQPLTRPNSQPCGAVRLPRRARATRRYRNVAWEGRRDDDGDRVSVAIRRYEPDARFFGPVQVDAPELFTPPNGALRVRRVKRMRGPQRITVHYTLIDERGERCEERTTLTVTARRR